MIVISSSLGKSGSTFITNMQEDLLAIVTPENGREALFRICGVRFFKRIDLFTVLRLLYINMVYGSIVVKTHSEPTWLIRLLIRLNFARATYSYRDLRDVILSSLDHGDKSRKGESGNMAFMSWVDVIGSIPFVMGLGRNWQRWTDFGQVHFIGYEALMNNQLAVFCAMNEYLGWEIEVENVQGLIDIHQGLRKDAVAFNKGTTDRYLTEMTEAEIAACNAAFGDMLVEMGYEV